MEEEDNGEGGKGKKDGGHSWSLPNVRQVNVKPVFFFSFFFFAPEYKGQLWVPSQGPFLWALRRLLLLVLVLLLHPPPSSEPGWAWRWHRGPFVVHQRAQALSPSFSLLLSVSLSPSPPLPLSPCPHSPLIFL